MRALRRFRCCSPRTSNDLNIGIYSDGRYSYQLCIYVIRVDEEDRGGGDVPRQPGSLRNRSSQYLVALKSVFERVAESGHWRNVA